MNDQAPTPDRAPSAGPDGPPPETTPPPADPAPAGDRAPAPPPPPGTSTAAADPPPPPGPGTAPAEGPRRPGAVGALTAVGVGLLAAAIAVSAVRSRSDGDLDWSNYAVGLGATAVLVLVALVATVVVRRRDHPLAREELITWPGSVAVLGVAVLFGIGLDGQDWLDDVFGYAIGGIVAVLALLGYVASRRAAFVVLALLGLGIVYANGFEDLFGYVGDGDDRAILVAVGLTGYVVAATALGWLLPTRATSGAAVGVVGVVGFALVLGAMLLAQFFSSMFGGFLPVAPDLGLGGPTDGGLGGDPFAGPESPSLDFDDDVWVILGLALLLTVLWALAAARTGHSGFTICAIALPTVVVPLATSVLAVEHPTWWGVVVAAVGAVLLAGAGLLGRLRARSARAAY